MIYSHFGRGNMDDEIRSEMEYVQTINGNPILASHSAAKKILK